MRVKSIEYPDGCKLEGWDKMVFERRIRKAFGSFYSVCDLNRCRSVILGQDQDSERYDELNAFHCEDFAGMTSAERQALVNKTAQYVGVGLVVVMKPSRRFTGSVVAAAAGLALGGASAWMIATAHDGKIVTRTSHAERFANEIQLPMPSVARAIEVAPEPVFNTTVRTSQPAATAKALARTVQSVSGQYDVSLTVTPVEGEMGPIAGQVAPTRGERADVEMLPQHGRDR